MAIGGADALRMTNTGTPTTTLEEDPDLAQGLTREEDDELRRLHYFSQVGSLAGQKLERFFELRLRDRRRTIRPPREFEATREQEREQSLGRRLLFRRFR